MLFHCRPRPPCTPVHSRAGAVRSERWGKEMRKLIIAVLAVFVLLSAVPAGASGRSGDRLPSQIDLPDGFFPEGIASGRGSTFYVGSLADGSIYRGDYRSGDGAVLTDPAGPFSTVGLNVDRYGRVWAAGGPSGTARVYDGRSGELLASYALTGPGKSFINDVIVNRDGAWFTDSGSKNPGAAFTGSPRLFLVPFGNRHRLPGPEAVEELPLDVPDVAFPNLNGIETTPDRRRLVVAHTVLGTLFTVDPSTGSASEVDLGGATFTGPDGLVRQGRTLYVVENGAARISAVQLHRRGKTGRVERVLPVRGAETPTTAAIFKHGLYVADARFTSGTGPYKIFRVPLSCRAIDATGEGAGAPPRAGDPSNLIRTVAEILRPHRCSPSSASSTSPPSGGRP